MFFTGTPSVLAGRYKHIASNIIYGKNKKCKTFLITSCMINECKSSVVTNLGLCLARLGYKVLLIDGDLMLPSLERQFGREMQKEGFLDFLQRNEDPTKAIISPVTGLKNLHLMVPGTTSETYVSFVRDNASLAVMLDNLKKTYDYIFFDVPPFEYAPEIWKLIKQVDTTFLCVRMNICTKESFSILLAQLSDCEEKIGGVIATGCLLSNVESSTSPYNKYYYRSHDNKRTRKEEIFVESERKARQIFKSEMKSRERSMRK